MEALDTGEPSQAAALMRAELARVRGGGSQRQGVPEQALEHYHAAAKHALRALCSGDGGRESGVQKRCSGRQGRGTRGKGKGRGEEGESAGFCECRWPLTALVAGVRVQQAACQAVLGDLAAAGSHLDAAGEVCASYGPDPSEAFPLQTAAASYQRALLLERQRAEITQEASVWGSQGAEEDLRPAAVESVSRRGRGRKGAAAAATKPVQAAAEPPGCDADALQQLVLLVEAYLLSRHVPGLSRCSPAPLQHIIWTPRFIGETLTVKQSIVKTAYDRGQMPGDQERNVIFPNGLQCDCRKVAGLLSVACGRLQLLHAAALFLHASFGASIGAQQAAIADSKLRSGQRRRGMPPDAAHLAAMGRVRAALRPDAFDDAQLRRLLADVASGQSPAGLLQYLEVCIPSTQVV